MVVVISIKIWRIERGMDKKTDSYIKITLVKEIDVLIKWSKYDYLSENALFFEIEEELDKNYKSSFHYKTLKQT